jgi:hypothetical protein
MKLTVLEQYGKGLVQCETALGKEILEKIERLKWSLWHGQVDKALGKIEDLASSIAPFSETYARFNHLVKALSALRTYIEKQAFDTELRAAISRWRGDCDRFCRVNGE